MKKADAHTLPIRVYYEDTDAGGIVYHANYLKFAERARTEWLEMLGYDHRRVRKDFNLLLVVRHLAIDYKAPARLDDRLQIETTVTSSGAATLDMAQIIRDKSKVLALLKVTVAAVSPEGKPMRLPPQLRQIFSSHKTAK